MRAWFKIKEIREILHTCAFLEGSHKAHDCVSLWHRNFSNSAWNYKVFLPLTGSSLTCIKHTLENNVILVENPHFHRGRNLGSER